jgi:hypothetical protein
VFAVAVPLDGEAEDDVDAELPGDSDSAAGVLLKKWM